MAIISANIHSTNTITKKCIVSIYKDSELIIDQTNIGLELNPDGSANTQWINHKVKTIVAIYDFDMKEHSEFFSVSFKNNA